jgi:hypothetical protein
MPRSAGPASTRGARCRGWCWTLNNPVLQPIEVLEILNPVSDYVIFQLEEGEQGTPHYQGYVWFKSRKRLSAIRALLPRARWAAAKGTPQQNTVYCTKEEGRLDGWWMGGELPEQTQGKRTDLHSVAEFIQEGNGYADVADIYPHLVIKYSRGIRALLNAQRMARSSPPEVVLAFGPTGCGKTRFAMEYSVDEKKELWASPLGNGLWFDGYCGEPVALIDEFAGAGSKYPLVGLLRLLDRYAIRVPVKGDFVWWCPEIIFITTNYHPREWYKWADRQPSYIALARRFSRVMWWATTGSEPTILDRPDVVGTGTYLVGSGPAAYAWGHFWDGPTGVVNDDNYFVCSHSDRYTF